jgi:hypothetical protein
MQLRWFVQAFVIPLLFVSFSAQGIVAADDLEAEFASTIRPMLKAHCEGCHSGDAPEAKFDVTEYFDSHRVTQHLNSWQFLVSRVVIGDMPPADHLDRPSPEVIHQLTSWTQRFRRQAAETNRGDPGVVGMRRLNHAEYNHAIRDLTHVDIRPTKTFPIDPANEAGFDNSAESLTMTPALASKYLDAARLVAEHLVLAPEGIRFAPHPVVTETDRDRYCVQRIVDFYRRLPTDLADYFLALWDLQRSTRSITEIANTYQVSDRYLTTLAEELLNTPHQVGPLAALQQTWKETVVPCNDQQRARDACRSLAAYVQELRAKLSPKVPSLKGPKGLHEGSQTLVLWRNREVARLRRSCRHDIFDEGDEDTPLLKADQAKLATDRDKVIHAYDQFCSLFPDAFLIVERGRHYAKEGSLESKGRLLSAGFHSMMGFFRDDQPLCELILSEPQKAELDRLWKDLECIALTPLRQYAGFIWFERAESSFIREPQFHFVRAEDKSANSQAMIQRFADVFLDKVKSGDPSQDVLDAVTFYFADINRQIRSLESELSSQEPKQLRDLLDFASRAFRRPLTETEDRELREFYASARRLPNADHRSAMEDTLVAILVSPRFLYRWDLKTPRETVEPLNALEFASRLSFFLWGSLPDQELYQAFEQGKTIDQQSLRAQSDRMLADPRAKGMLREFLGNWLDFRRFESHSGVDRNRFPSFDDALRSSMAEEPIEYFYHLLQNDGTLNDLVDSKFLVVNPVLAKHYHVSLPQETFDADHWQRISITEETERGGLIPMGVFLTQNSPGLRTSPVKRGYWVVRRLLGEKIPPPPPNVPELPNSEQDTGDLTLRELLAKHREHPSCAACHNRFDAAGLLLEGFDPIGRPREIDLGGRKISSMAILPEGDQTEGLVGLKRYIIETRLEDFRRNFCESLLAYALGRTLIVSDDLLVEEMMARLSANGNRIRAAFDVIVQSQQFQNKRNRSREKTEP